MVSDVLSQMNFTSCQICLDCTKGIHCPHTPVPAAALFQYSNSNSVVTPLWLHWMRYTKMWLWGQNVQHVEFLIHRGRRADRLTLTLNYSAPYGNFGAKLLGDLLTGVSSTHLTTSNQGLSYKRYRSIIIIIFKTYNNIWYREIHCEYLIVILGFVFTALIEVGYINQWHHHPDLF